MQPVLYSVKSFDANQQDCRFKFAWSGPQVQGSWLTIYSNNTGYRRTVVYDHKNISIGSLEHIVPAGSGLVNGTTYQATIRVGFGDPTNMTWSDVSDSISFTCYTIPSFVLSVNYDEPGTHYIRNSYVTATITYSQNENVPLAAYNVLLKSEDGAVLQESGEIYMQESGVSQITYVFNGLQDQKTYYLQAIGQTRGTDYTRMRMDTGEDPVTGLPLPLVEIFVIYSSPAFVSGINATNKPKDGGVLFTSNFVSVEGRSDKPVEYIDNEKANLLDNTVYFDDHFVAKNDWDLGVLVEGFSINKPIVQFRENTRKTTPNGILYYREGWFPDDEGILTPEEIELWPEEYLAEDSIKVGYFEITVDTSYGMLVVDSKYFIPIEQVSSQQYQIWIERKNGYYTLDASEMTPNSGGD